MGVMYGMPPMNPEDRFAVNGPARVGATPDTIQNQKNLGGAAKDVLVLVTPGRALPGSAGNPVQEAKDIRIAQWQTLLLKAHLLPNDSPILQAQRAGFEDQATQDATANFERAAGLPVTGRWQISYDAILANVLATGVWPGGRKSPNLGPGFTAPAPPPDVAPPKSAIKTIGTLIVLASPLLLVGWLTRSRD